MRGTSLNQADRVVIMLHGRGDRASSFIHLSDEFPIEGAAFLAIQAKQNTWDPYSFLEPQQRNEPHLTTSLNAVDELVEELEKRGFTSQQLHFLGFSQGACLTLEYTTRHARRYGSITAFTGGLIGHELDANRYSGSFDGTSVFLGSSDHDPHVPESRIEASRDLLEKMGADVTMTIYPGMGHTINRAELSQATDLLQGSV
jgi:phospholipase/carboxylesterase